MNMRETKRFARFATSCGLVAALGAGCVGCSSSGSDQGNSGGSASEIKLMVIGDISSPVISAPQIVTGAQAAAKAINAKGGIAGHQIQILSCNDQDDPNVAANCARQAISDKVSAVVGMLSLQSGSVDPILQSANIASIGGEDISPEDHTNPISFPIVSSNVAFLATALTMPGYNDCRHPAVLTENNPTSVGGAVVIKKFFAAEVPAAAPVKIVQVSATATDISAPVADLMSGGTDCVFPLGAPNVDLELVKDVYSSGQKAKISLVGSTPLSSLLQLGSAAKGVYMSSEFELPGTSPQGDAFASAMKSVDPSAVQDSNAEGAYAGVKIFQYATKSLKNFDAKSVLDALNSAKNIDIGVCAPFSSFPANSGVPGLPRVFDYSMYGYVVSGNTLKATSNQPIDVRSALKQFGG
jgi:ABC-type branched-subunit amino acid transport system substrate-binding protein